MKILKVSLGVALLGAMASPALAAFTCETVARTGQSDGNGGTFSRRFHTTVAVNGSGDTLFSARPDNGRDRLYLFSGDGSSKLVLATAGDPAPSGLVYKTGKAFTSLANNEFQDVAFHSRLFGNREGIFGRFGAGAVKKITVTGDVSPCGSTFTSFPALSSRISNAGVVSFVANAADGTTAVVSGNLNTAALGCEIEEGAVVDGREICDILDVGRGNTGLVAARAVTKVDCSNGLEAPLDAIVDVTSTNILALEGDPSPIAGTTYSAFSLQPSIIDDDVAFLASVTGAVTTDAIIVDDGSPAVAIAEDDLAPDVGGRFALFNDFALTTAGVLANARLKGTNAKTGILSASEAAVVKTSAPPIDGFGLGSKYTTLQKKNGFSVDGDWLAVMVKVKDTTAPSKKAGIVRCEN